MSDRPTPETEQYIEDNYNVRLFDAEKCFEKMKKLERERDEARETISDVLRALKAMEHEGPRLAALRVREERDKARAYKRVMKNENERLRSAIRKIGKLSHTDDQSALWNAIEDAQRILTENDKSADADPKFY